MAQPVLVSQKERRSYRRTVSRLKKRCQLKRVAEEGTWMAMVRNVSNQGIGLVLNRPVKRGMLLVLELPTDSRQTGTPHLIRVMRAQAQPDNQWWFVGGTFVKKLTQVQLNALRVRTPSIVPQSERRTTLRHTTRLKTPCPLVRTIEEGPWLATIRNVSPRGIGLIADRPFRPGSFLTIELPTRDGKLSKPRLLKVTHVRRQLDSPWWVFGGMFLHRLTPDEFEMLL